MTPEEARLVLERTRPVDIRSTDPEVAEALRIVQGDPSLAQWWEKEKAWQETVRKSLRGITPPAGLKAQLLASARSKPAYAPFAAPSAPRWLALAAAVAILLTGAWWWQRTAHESSYNTWRQRMARTALREYGMDIETNSLQAVRQYLVNKTGHSSLAIPPTMSTVPVLGGATVRFKNQPVSLICFDRGGGKIAWLFAIRKDALPGAPPLQKMSRIDSLAMASWTVGEMMYLLAVEGDESALRQYL